MGACEKYGGPLIMIFMGTATAIVYVDASNAYHGGAIAPGMGISEQQSLNSAVNAFCINVVNLQKCEKFNGKLVACFVFIG